MANGEPEYGRIPVDPLEVGAELLDILSRGLYSDAKDAIREYVQNGIDARADRVTVTVAGPVVSVMDNGAGMDWSELLLARRFGMSGKSPSATVGYRGIGIYSSFGMCETLTITTKQAESSELLRLSFEFGQMRRILEEDRTASTRGNVALANLLYEHTKFSRSPYSGAHRDHFTLVQMEGLTPEYRGQLNDRSAMFTYLLNTVPVALPEESYGPVVNQWLVEHAQCQPVQVVLRTGDEPEAIVAPLIAEGVDAPMWQWVSDSKGERLAFIWYALSVSTARIKSEGGESGGVSGFLLKSKGFTLGDRSTLKPFWPPQGGRTLYHHFTGEIHVLASANVYPNAARDDLEMSPERQVLVRHIQDLFMILNKKADAQRQLVKIGSDLDALHSALVNLKQQSTALDSDKLEAYRAARNISDEVEGTLKELGRLAKSRPAAPVLTPEQSDRVKQFEMRAKALQQTAAQIATVTGRQTDTQESAKKAQGGGSSARPRTPEHALIESALARLQEQAEHHPGELDHSLRDLQSALSLNSLSKASAALDEIKATGLVLSDSLEAARKDLRTRLGLAPTGPVSLVEGFQSAGLEAATSREEALIRAVDRGILRALGGRGERYESLLGSIVESAGEEPGYR